jgi:hypothetical protein
MASSATESSADMRLDVGAASPPGQIISGERATPPALDASARRCAGVAKAVR